MLKVLTINWSRDGGSIAEIIKNIEERLNTKCQFYHCYQVGGPAGENEYRVASWNVTRFYYLLARLVGIKYGIGNLPTLGTLNYIRKVNPDIVHVHCPNFYNLNIYMLFEYLKKYQIPTVITNHAEFYYTGNCPHAFDCKGYQTECKKCSHVFDRTHRYLFNRTAYEWKKMKFSFDNADHFAFTVVSEWQKRRIATSPIVGNIPVYLIENAVNTDIFNRREVLEKQKYLLPGYEHIVLHVTSNFSDNIHDPKGGYYLFEAARRCPQYQFIVAGPFYIKDIPAIPHNVKMIGNIADKKELGDLYNIADLTVLTSKRETFGMSCAESLCCGTPVVAFESGGTETIALHEYSKFVKYGDVEALVKSITEMIGMKKQCTETVESRAREKYTVKTMTSKYYQLYLKMLEKCADS